jgi:hypothetical protein
MEVMDGRGEGDGREGVKTGRRKAGSARRREGERERASDVQSSRADEEYWGVCIVQPKPISHEVPSTLSLHPSLIHRAPESQTHAK